MPYTCEFTRLRVSSFRECFRFYRDVVVFALGSVDGACRELKARGASIAVEPTDHADWGVRTAHLRDPDGNLIEINQPLPR